MSAPELSIVVPAYNEALSLGHLCQVLLDVVRPCCDSFEILVIDDGSRDATRSVAESLAQGDPRIVVVGLSRNFGKEAAMTAGLSRAKGRGILFIDADLQHPPALIPEMISAWRRGYDVVNAVKRSRGSESYVYGKLSGVFNRLMSAAIGSNMAGMSDFKLIDRHVADVLLQMSETHRFFRGMVAWVGFRAIDIPFDVSERQAGVTKWGIVSLVRYTLKNLLAFSALPLVAVAIGGFVSALVGSVLLLQTLFRYFSGSAVVGFTTVIAVQVLLGGMILMGLGVVSLYIAQIYEEIKRRPIFIVQKRQTPFEPTDFNPYPHGTDSQLEAPSSSMD